MKTVNAAAGMESSLFGEVSDTLSTSSDHEEAQEREREQDISYVASMAHAPDPSAAADSSTLSRAEGTGGSEASSDLFFGSSDLSSSTNRQFIEAFESTLQASAFTEVDANVNAHAHAHAQFDGEAESEGDADSNHGHGATPASFHQVTCPSVETLESSEITIVEDGQSCSSSSTLSLDGDQQGPDVAMSWPTISSISTSASASMPMSAENPAPVPAPQPSHEEEGSRVELQHTNLDSIATLPSQTLPRVRYFAPKKKRSKKTKNNNSSNSNRDVGGSTGNDHSANTGSTRAQTQTRNLYTTESTSAAAEVSSSMHTREAFVNVAERLLSQSRPSENWYSNLTESDWRQLHEQASMIAKALANDDEFRIQSSGGRPSSEADRVGMDDMADILPAEYICPVCSDVVVGAMIRSCGCGDVVVPSGSKHKSGDRSSLCGENAAACFACVKSDEEPRMCNHCDMAVVLSPHYDLDESIYMKMQSIALRDARCQAISRRYFARFFKWYNASMQTGEGDSDAEGHSDGNGTGDAMDAIAQERLLSKLIAAEEQFFWDVSKDKARAQQARHSFGVVATTSYFSAFLDLFRSTFTARNATIAVMTVSSIGLMLLSRRRRV